jgi:hypothetical protein
MLECDLPPQSAGLIRSLGQDLLAPPNVKGWDGGVAWITTNTLLARYNQTALLVQADSAALPRARPAQQARRPQNPAARGRPGGVDLGKIVTAEERSDRDRLIAVLEKRLLQAKLNPKQQETVREFLAGKTQLNENDIRGAIRLIMSTPEYQLT